MDYNDITQQQPNIPLQKEHFFHILCVFVLYPLC